MFGKLLFTAVVVAFISYELSVYLNTKEATGIIHTKSGKLRGFLQQSRGGRQFASFYGIPYAEPPVRHGRFQAPREVKKWTQVFMAVKQGIECIHYEYIFDFGLRGQEDCLVLNVFTPALRDDTSGDIDATKKYPVIAYIPGGGFMSGSSANYEGHYFMDQDVVLVTMNYRIGALGFLSSGDSTIKGNMGLKDQRMALKWIKDNIENFGGDSDRITIMGESAGAVSVHLHMMSPKSTGLFHRAILMSGHALTPWAIKKNVVQQCQKFAEKMGCSAIVPSEFLQCLAKLDARDIAQTHAVHRFSFVDPHESYGPTLEVAEHDSNAFLTKEPRKIMTKGDYNRVPIMIGVNEAEGLIWVARAMTDPNMRSKLNNTSDWYRILPRLLGMDNLSHDKAEAITNYYFGHTDHLDAISQVENFTNLYSDRVFNMHLSKIIRNHLAKSSSPVHLYYYAYRGDFSLFKMATSVPRDGYFPTEVYLGWTIVREWLLRLLGRQEKLPAGHADELPLLFNIPPFTIRSESSDYDMSKEMLRSFVQFASGTSELALWSQPWTPATTTASLYMKIDTPEHSGLIQAPFQQRVNFWSDLMT